MGQALPAHPCFLCDTDHIAGISPGEREVPSRYPRRLRLSTPSRPARRSREGESREIPVMAGVRTVARCSPLHPPWSFGSVQLTMRTAENRGAGEEASEEQGGAAPDEVFQGPGSRGKRGIHGAYHAVSEGTEHVPLAGVHELPGECIVVPSPADFGRRHVRGEGKCHLGHIGKQGRARAPGSLAGHLKGSGLRARAAHAGKEAGRQCHAAFITERTGEIFPVTPDQKAGSRLARFSSHGPPRYIWTFFSSR